MQQSICQNSDWSELLLIELPPVVQFAKAAISHNGPLHLHILGGGLRGVRQYVQGLSRLLHAYDHIVDRASYPLSLSKAIP